MCNTSIQLCEFCLIEELRCLVFESSINLGSRRLMKSGLRAGGLSEGGSNSSGRTAGQDVRESGDMPSSATTRRVGMSIQGEGWQSSGILIAMGEAKDFMGFLPKST
jgi:hypothetical protein